MIRLALAFAALVLFPTAPGAGAGADRATAIAAGDFDADGVPDLVSGHEGQTTGYVTLQRGNVDAVFPQTPQARERRARGAHTEAPFLDPARRFEVPVTPDFVAAGDFDADGMLDVVVASLAGDALYLLRGNGRGRLRKATRHPVPALIRLDGAPVALLPMRLNEDAIADRIVVDDGGDVSIVRSVPAATITVDSASGDPSPGDGECTLYEAIQNANDDADLSDGDCAAGSGADSIVFKIDGGGARATITPAHSRGIDPIRDSVVINGNTQECPEPPCIELDGSVTGPHSGLEFLDGASTVRGLAIVNFGADGIRLLAPGNFVEGNFIGTNPAGDRGVGNARHGVRVLEGNNTIGGAVAAARNVISGNAHDGISVSSRTSMNRIIGNYIGVDPTGTSALPNFKDGVDLASCFGASIGGFAAGERNVISGNEGRGVVLRMETENTSMLGNFIGVDRTGTRAVPNRASGILVTSGSTSVTVAGSFDGARSVISGNGVHGVSVAGQPDLITSEIAFFGNFIGTDVTGTVAVPNAAAGIHVAAGASEIVIGGFGPNARNLISGNAENGVALDADSSSSVVSGNLIGTDLTGIGGLGNALNGVIVRDSRGHVIGGDSVGEGNVIAHNGVHGVAVVDTATNNAILGNSIRDNARLGIDLAADGVTPNDPGDFDFGPNTLQNFPVLASAVGAPEHLKIVGSLAGLASHTYRIEFFASRVCEETDHGQGARRVDFTDVTTDEIGNAEFFALFDSLVGRGEAVTGTATDELDNTSEFSACVLATCLELVAFTQTIRALDPNLLVWGVPEDVRFVAGNLAAVPDYVTSGDGTRLSATSLDIAADLPGAGSGFYYLVSPLGCGSWQTLSAAEPDRDAALP